MDGPLNFQRKVARPIPYTTAIARAMNMQAIRDGLLPTVRGWHCTVSDQFMLLVGGGRASPTVMEFPITFDGIWVPQFPTTNNFATTTYFLAPSAPPYIYLPGPTQPPAQPVPAGYRARVNKVSVEIGWVTSTTDLWDPGDYTRWSWKRKHVDNVAYSVVPGALERPCVSRTLYGVDVTVGAVSFPYQQLYFYPQADMPPIFLEPGDLNILRVENFTSNAAQTVALSMSCSGVMWPIGLEGPGV